MFLPTREWALTWFLYFSATAFIGWMLESTYRSFAERRLVNSGFLSGPFVPIYGFGALSIALLARLLSAAHGSLYWAVLVVAPTVVEYLASFLLEKAFGLRLWDYRDQALNVRGRVCLLFSAFWAALTVAAVFWLEPLLLGIIEAAAGEIRYFAAGALFMYFVMDTIGSSRSLFNFADFVAELKELAARGGALLPNLELEAKKLPREIRRLLKPLRAFPLLGGQLHPLRPAIPDWIAARLEKLIGGRHFRK